MKHLEAREPFIVRNADGSTEGRHPDEMPRETLATLHAGGPILAAIRAKCLDCCVEQPSEVRKCTAVKCALWPYRMGTNPFHGARGRTPTHNPFVKKSPGVSRESRQDEAAE
jgi:hypothetical protein